jgi:anti-sigma factor ChrR (cupin superfamily)
MWMAVSWPVETKAATKVITKLATSPNPQPKDAPMLVNPDFSRRAIVRADAQRWVASPQAGVERVMLDRLGDERARATSLVRYALGSAFPAHGHPGGEEILVLSGTFSDATGHYGPGWYLRNPPGTAHQPSSAHGALIFVKLWQMQANDWHQVRIHTRDAAAWVAHGPRQRCPVYASATEQVSLERLAPGERLAADTAGGAELLVVEGALVDGAEPLDRGSWLRLPPRAAESLFAGRDGATLYLKTGHLTTLTVWAEVTP